MKEHPILFYAPMVRALLDGSKTQTRRALRVQPHGAGAWVQRGAEWLFPNVCPHTTIKCPYGQGGDRLWVRETWQGPLIDEDDQEDWRENGPEKFLTPEFCAYRATDKLDAIDADGNQLGWRPSIHMPRWACRITLEIVSVRVEQLQDISYEDALAEGIGDYRQAVEAECVDETADQLARRLKWPQRAYAQLWEQINGAGSWAANSWVWVIAFRKVST